MEWNEKDHPRNEDGEFIEKIKSYNDMSIEELKKEASNKKMTPAEKIASVQINSGKDNILPELNEDAIKEMGISKNKKVLLKKDVIERNSDRHGDVVFDTNKILGEVLYDFNEIFKGNKDKDYYTFVKFLRIGKKEEQEYGLVLLDISDEKEYFEIVHWHWISDKHLEKMKNKLKQKSACGSTATPSSNLIGSRG